ncbi:WXG100 family type VII secretion target [Haloglycomyces albus]|uniref:WXG100 family type VII secretion target n=1 Tax=Haloglycomyces albus TaxID=526067 RepID=UPI0004BA483F|nr:type VII secretion target [Haloglycomyces albus]
MTDGFNVDPDELDDHSSKIKGLAEEVAPVLSAADTVVQDDEAYGLFCEWLPSLLESKQEQFKDLVSGFKENLEAHSRNLGDVAAGYRETDQIVSESLQKIMSELEG